MQPQKTAFLFPGQGSQEVGMGSELVQTFPIAKEIFEYTDDILGLPLSQTAWIGPEEILNETENTQPILLTHSVAALSIFNNQFENFVPAYVAGHSMGEISALVAAKSLPFREALILASRRGELMSRAGNLSPGGMAATLALDITEVEKICSQASTDYEIVQVANDNCPGQVVISGHFNALERAMTLAKEAKARKVVRLAVSIAAHSPLMKDAQEDFNEALVAAPIVDPQISIIGNVNASPLSTALEIRSDLSAQLYSKVRWTETIEFLLSKGVDTFIEIGSGDVLIGLVKRIDRKTKRFSLGKPEDFEKIGEYFN